MYLYKYVFLVQNARLIYYFKVCVTKNPQNGQAANPGEEEGVHLSKKRTYFFKEKILYPCVNIKEEETCGLTLDMADYADILYHIENNGYAHL